MYNVLWYYALKQISRTMKALGRQHIGPPHEKPCLWGMQLGATYNSFLSYRDYLKNNILLVPNLLRYIERTRKALTRLRRCAGWSTHLLFACNKVRFSRVAAHIKRIIILSSIHIKRKNKFKIQYHCIKIRVDPEQLAFSRKPADKDQPCLSSTWHWYVNNFVSTLNWLKIKNTS